MFERMGYWNLWAGEQAIPEGCSWPTDCATLAGECAVLVQVGIETAVAVAAAVAADQGCQMDLGQIRCKGCSC